MSDVINWVHCWLRKQPNYSWGSGDPWKMIPLKILLNTLMRSGWCRTIPGLRDLPAATHVQITALRPLTPGLSILWVSSYVNWETYSPNGPEIERTTRNSVVNAQLLYPIERELISGLKRIEKYYSIEKGAVCNISQQPRGCLQYRQRRWKILRREENAKTFDEFRKLQFGTWVITIFDEETADSSLCSCP